MRTAILGATGLVGRTMLKLLESRAWADDEPLLLCSSRSAGQELRFRGRPLRCQDAEAADLKGVQLALCSAGAAASRRHAPRLRDAGAWVVDNSSAFRLDADVPLVVPEVNPALVAGRCGAAAGRGGIIANPNCSTIQLAVALAPLLRSFGLREVHVTTLQAVSGAGQKGLDELARQTADPEARCEVFARPIAANVVPEIGAAMPDGSFEEEAKVGRELRKIFELTRLAVTCTATRVPVACGHAAAVRVLTERPAPVAAARVAMAAWPGLEVAAGAHEYRTPLEIAGDAGVHVGRLRGEPGRGDVLLFWVVADNLLKGAAWNALQIADLLVGTPEGR